MRTVFFSLFALAASAMATPLHGADQAKSRQLQVDKLAAAIRGYTAGINATVSAIPENITLDDQHHVATALGPDIQGIIHTLEGVAVELSQTTTSLAERDAPSDGSYPPGKIRELACEVLSTLKAAILQAGYDCMTTYIEPLLVALAAIVQAFPRTPTVFNEIIRTLDDILTPVGVTLIDFIFYFSRNVMGDSANNDILAHLVRMLAFSMEGELRRLVQEET